MLLNSKTEKNGTQQQQQQEQQDENQVEIYGM